MATAGLNNLTGEDVPGPDYSDTAISVLFSDRFTRAIRAAEKGRGKKKRKKEKRITVVAANNVVLASNRFYF